MIKKTLLFIGLSLAVVSLKAQKRDTLQISTENINPNALREGTHRYLVYFKMKKDSVRTQTQFWTRKVTKGNFNGKPTIEIYQEWEDKDSIMHIVKTISDIKTMQTFFHQTWWKIPVSRTSTAKTVNLTTVDFTNKTVEYNGKFLSDTTSGRQAKSIWEGYQSSKDKFFLNWHSDLEIFPMLPYKDGLTFVIPFYDPGTASNYQKVAYTVTGSSVLTGYNDQKIDCWLLVHEEKGNKEVFWISKKTNEVLKLEQEVNGRIYRYKIKLGFSV
ncbi:hypothetical protein [Pedobacter insulae]|uniref:Uncharacterized protein n=1 Tax=Pedobacter insulae TaxID=414048 RepID=A0A1I2WXC1_9SPHI|nr:hypothetical protein [Pedobacter insulae]SFH05842.1 hypothetical protein SAMN04489864_104350 [Pedobacter insulae]